MSSHRPHLPRYQLAEQLYDGARTRVYRGIDRETSQPVILKILRNPYPSFNELAQFRNQYAIACNLEHPAIVRPLALERDGNGYLLIMPDEGAISLADYWQGETRSLTAFLNIAIQLAEVLHYLIQQRVIHKDIKPANILIHPQTRQVKLIDFSIATLLPKEQQQLINPNILEGTLAYISPEQTGRMNRGIDYRTDFYSLGVTFYELLAGKLPFETNDPMELVHCHIAKMPSAFGNREWGMGNGEQVPQVLLDIAIELMAKNAEDRYQSALGLKFDLEKCLKLWQEVGEIEPFELGERDVCDRFLIPEKLYGREKEVAQLLAAFERISQGAGERGSRGSRGSRGAGEAGEQGRRGAGEQGSRGAGEQRSRGAEEQRRNSELLLVAGFSGIGKTAVINEVHKPIVKQRGYFIKGKFDQFNRNIPFSAFVQAFRDLMKQLLGESDGELAIWKSQILAAVGENGQVLIDVIPELEQIIGKQNPVPQLSGSAAQNRFNLLFRKFVGIFATREHPLAIFLDDLQWADSASLNLLKLLMEESETGYLLVLGAYRDNEVFPTHPLMLTLAELSKTPAVISTITLQPLAIAHINRLLADTLNCREEIAQPLSELVYQKTQGNPFFTTQFLKGLQLDGLIAFNRNLGYWECDLVRVRNAALTDDVVEFMARRLRKLPAATQNILKLAACIGNQFDLDTLALVCEEDREKIAVELWDALQEGLILPISETYKFFQGSGKETIAKNVTVGYRFLHDRVQQAAYSLIPEPQKQLTHYTIGKLLLENTPEAERDKKIFEIANQLNYGAERMTSEAELAQLTQLNLKAGIKAKRSTAYAAAIDYFTQGLKSSQEDWSEGYDLALSFHSELAECYYLIGQFESSQIHINIILNRANCLIDKIKAYEINISIHMAQLSMNEAIDLGLKVLEMLKIDLEIELPENPIVEDLIELDRMGNIDAYSAMRILMQLLAPAYVTGTNLLYKLTSTMIRLSIEYGNCGISAFGYTVHALLLTGKLGQIELGYQYGQLALNVLDKLDVKEMKSKVLNGFNAHVLHWKKHIRNSWSPLQDSIKSGLEIGDIQYACHSATNYCEQLFFGGNELNSTSETYFQCVELAKSFKQEHSKSEQSIWGQLCLNLLGKTEKTLELKGELLNEDEMLSIWEKSENTALLFMFYAAKTMLLYWMGQGDKALVSAELARENIGGITGLFAITNYNFYHSLSLLCEFSEVDRVGQNGYLEQVSENQTTLREWSNFAPMNFQHKFDLVEAERQRILGRRAEAMDLYDRAIALAKENEYIQEEALANELAAQFYLDWGKEKVATSYMQEAYYGYARWGAQAKTDRLEEKYPQLLAPILHQPQGKTLTPTAAESITKTTTEPSEALDLAAVIKASHAFSGEIELDALLSKLMHIVTENAGADKGALILNHSDAWEVVAQCDRDRYSLSTLPLETADTLPRSIVNTVKHTQEILLLNNLERDKTRAADPYLAQHPPQSLLCAPILNQGKLVGILYLENHLAADAFTPNRIEILNLLTAQAAISIENAQLYHRLENYNRTLEEQVSQRTQQLQRNNQQLTDTLQQLTTTQNELIQSEKMAALGQLVAGIAHEINTPLGAIRAAIGNADKALQVSLSQLPQLLPQLTPQQQTDFFSFLERALSPQLSLSTREKRQVKRSLTAQLQSHDMAEAKRLAHLLTEGGLHDSCESQLSLLQTPQAEQIVQIAYHIARLQTNSQNINNAVERASKIVFALKSYARYDQNEVKQPAQIKDGIETVLELYRSYLKKGVEAIRRYQPVPDILCYPDELAQVWTNLIHNGIQAMEGKGTLEIGIGRRDRNLVVEVTDSGGGIPPDIQDKIFQPFFTTKSAGEGSGLGLDIARKIIEKHQGTIAFSSVPGKTTFTVALPIQQPDVLRDTRYRGGKKS